ncbi:MAG: efflux RND transporter periplasmic adaptor subunit, partial [Blastocatellia bacterium]
MRTALITVRAPASGIVTERFVNDGAGVDAGKPLFTITNLSTVWVIANVPEANIGQVRQGAYAEIRATALGSGKLIGRVSYI